MEGRAGDQREGWDKNCVGQEVRWHPRCSSQDEGQGLAGPETPPGTAKDGRREEGQASAINPVSPEVCAHWEHSPSPSWEQGPQDRRHQHPVTPVFRRPGEGHGALYDFLVSCVFRRFRSLRSMGLKVFRPGLGTFSTYSSTRPLSPPDSWLRRSRSTPCQAS